MLGAKLKLWVASAERTHVQELIDQMKRVDSVYKNARQLIDRIRANAQPNKSHRSDETLVPDEDEDERLRYVATLRESAAGTSFVDPTVTGYLKKLADVNEAVAKLHDKFLKQVQVFCVKELRKFAEETYSNIKHCFNDFEKKRDAYDLARHKLKSCKPEEVEAKGAGAKQTQQEFERQAVVLHDTLQKMPEHEMAVAKAIYMYTRAETDYHREVHELLRKIPAPGGKHGAKTGSGKGA